ncbi:NAD(P)H-binding protein [Dyadobacter chenwenxiniae]|uniref:NAD(P)H-binding protein n=1 Tax=Dyadobacter chenwenxiniae TaxID=2906456 RepID=A0A9X1PSE3_9BACT|nr:NAD(P)H-binding protein [Dyadobacter chenwenxiniae]MCF0065569.1 NAD(P)H-binding protein [Dyadobacter chenwenxiniae]UON85480.1 NAD(P)H-binding protein [Dyadobacter chenwenxiniae]
MKIVITGSLGHISKPLAKELVQNGHAVTVISSNPDKQKDIEAIGAMAAIGSIEDVSFLAKTFTGADAVYTMLPPFNFQENANLDAREEARRLTSNYVEAIQQSGVKKVVHLSSIGAHTDKGNGLLAFHFVAEQVLKQLPADVTITFMRPVGFYYNLYQFMDIVKGEGFLKGFVGLFLTVRHYGLTGLLQGKKGLIVSNYGAEDKMPWVSPMDIAAAISEELTSAFKGRKARYVASEELTCNQIANILGTAVGKPYLKWVTISDKQMLDALLKYKMPLSLANDITEMNASQRNGGILFEDYYKNIPTMGKVKMKDFAQEFAAVYNSK